MGSSNFSSKYKNSVVNIVILFVALFIAHKLYVGQQQLMQRLNAEKENEIKKNAELETIGKLEKRFVAYKKYLNQKDLTSAMETISTLAQSSRVRIVSVRPADEKKDAVFAVYSLNYKVQAGSYHALGDFVSRLESHPFVFIINDLSVIPSQATEDSEFITATLVVSTVLLR